MRRRIAVFLCMMMVFAMTTGVAMAETISENESVGKEEYRRQQIGDSSEFWARATLDTAYTTIENTYSTSRYLACYVKEFAANIGWTDSSAISGTKLSGAQISTEINRDTNLVGYYYHSGYCYYNQYSGGTIDSYLYNAYQRYTMN